MPAGRPTKYKAEFCETIIELGKAGKSVMQMAAGIGVTSQTVYEWAKEKPEFSDALTRARELQQCWWEEIGQNGLFGDEKGRQLNTALWSRSMAARFPKDYTERRNNNHTSDDGSMSPQKIIIQAANASDSND